MTKFFYFYTPDYQFWDIHLSITLKEIFDVQPIKIDSLSLSNTGHHFLNLTVKIELVIDCIKKNMNSFILFSDATVFMNRNNVSGFGRYIQNKIDANKDILFIYLQQDHINIGMMLLKCDEKVLRFWENILQRMNEKKQRGENTWDQGEVNNLLIYEKYPIDFGYFEPDKVWAGGQMPRENCDNFLVYKNTVDPKSNRQLVRLTSLRNIGLISNGEFEYWAKRL